MIKLFIIISVKIAENLVQSSSIDVKPSECEELTVEDKLRRDALIKIIGYGNIFG